MFSGKCPRCGGVFNGPYHQKYFGSETILKICTRCGLKEREPCNDGKKKRDALIAELGVES